MLLNHRESRRQSAGRHAEVLCDDDRRFEPDLRLSGLVMDMNVHPRLFPGEEVEAVASRPEDRRTHRLIVARSSPIHGERKRRPSLRAVVSSARASDSIPLRRDPPLPRSRLRRRRSALASHEARCVSVPSARIEPDAGRGSRVLPVVDPRTPSSDGPRAGRRDPRLPRDERALRRQAVRRYRTSASRRRKALPMSSITGSQVRARPERFERPGRCRERTAQPVQQESGRRTRTPMRHPPPDGFLAHLPWPCCFATSSITSMTGST